MLNLRYLMKYHLVSKFIKFCGLDLHNKKFNSMVGSMKLYVCNELLSGVINPCIIAESVLIVELVLLSYKNQLLLLVVLQVMVLYVILGNRYLFIAMFVYVLGKA